MTLPSFPPRDNFFTASPSSRDRDKLRELDGLVKHKKEPPSRLRLGGSFHF